MTEAEQELFPVEDPNPSAAEIAQSKKMSVPSTEDEIDIDPDCPDRGGDAL